MVSKILYLRQHYHFGPRKIADYVKRFHQILVAGSSVHRILERHHLNRLPANQKHRPHGKRWQRYEEPQPGHRLQLDVKFLERIPGSRRRLYQFTSCVSWHHRDSRATTEEQFAAISHPLRLLSRSNPYRVRLASPEISPFRQETVAEDTKVQHAG